MKRAKKIFDVESFYLEKYQGKIPNGFVRLEKLQTF
jgi:hypothetical protein